MADVFSFMVREVEGQNAVMAKPSKRRPPPRNHRVVQASKRKRPILSYTQVLDMALRAASGARIPELALEFRISDYQVVKHLKRFRAQRKKQ